jgi:hypothetical protein
MSSLSSDSLFFHVQSAPTLLSVAAYVSVMSFLPSLQPLKLILYLSLQTSVYLPLVHPEILYFQILLCLENDCFKGLSFHVSVFFHLLIHSEQ